MDLAELDSGLKEYLRGLQASIESQEATIESLRSKNKRLEDELKIEEGKVEKLNEEVAVLKKKLESSEATNDKAKNPLSITEEITQAAQEVVNDQYLKNMAFEETTGLYYDYQSGLYYDAVKRLFYDGENGKWLNYDASSGEREYVSLEYNTKEHNCSSSNTESESEPEGDINPLHRLNHLLQKPVAKMRKPKSPECFPTVRCPVHLHHLLLSKRKRRKGKRETTTTFTIWTMKEAKRN